MPKPDLTICSASYYSRSCLDLNWVLTTHMNRASDFCWLAVENSGDAVASERLDPDDNRFVVLDGIQAEKAGGARGNYQRAAALDKALAHISGRWSIGLGRAGGPRLLARRPVCRERWGFACCREMPCANC